MHQSGTADALTEAGTLSIRASREAGVLTLEALGERDIASAPMLDHELARAEEADADQIVLDLSNLDFTDVSGLRVLTLASSRSASDGDRLRIIRGRGQVSRVAEMTGLAPVLRLVD